MSFLSSARSQSQSVANVQGNERGQRRVCLVEPSSRRDTVRDIDDLTGGETIKIREDRLFHEIRMDLRNPVDTVASRNGKVGHAQTTPAVFVHDRHAPEKVDIAGKSVPHLFEEPVVDLVDDLQMARQESPRKGERATFQALRA